MEKKIIYTIPNEPMGIGNLLHRVKDRMEELGITDLQVEFEVIDGKICVVEPEWEEEE